MPGRHGRRCAPDWRKSTFSGDSGSCTEIACAEQSVLVRDSRNPSGTVLQFSADQWSSFMNRVRAGGEILAD
jgi:Domain of unknown function (DUF397)